MKKFFLINIFFSLTILSRADEGMWLLMLLNRLNYIDMQKQGLKLTPEEIYSINNSSLKDAIVQFNGGCTGEIISNEGLILTNHHCGYKFIAELSTPSSDYIKDGFWSKNKKEEKKPAEIFVRFFIRMDDVTNRINKLLSPEMTIDKRNEIIKQETQKIEQENSEGGKYKVVLKSFFNGNEFYYFVYQDFKDVRMVAAPPSSIGNYGGDTDNWEWPRHTGDFSLFRVYTDKNGNPAEYSPENIPMKPKKALSINLSGVKLNDYTMILGYPGVTNRYLSSYGVNHLINKEYPAFVEASKEVMDVLQKHMKESTQKKLDYAPLYANISNYWKNRQGTIDAIIKNKTIDKKIAYETQFQKWIYQDSAPYRIKQYGGVLNNLKNYYTNISDKGIEKQYLRILLKASTYISETEKIGKLLETYINSKDTDKTEHKNKLLKKIEQVYKKINPEVEEDLAATLVQLYIIKAPINSQLKAINELTLGLADLKVRDMIKYSIFKDKNTLLNFIENNPSIEQLNLDKLYTFSKTIEEQNKNKTQEEKIQEDNFHTVNRLYVDGLKRTYSSTKFYPDANSTIRLTYGTVKDLPRRIERPNDASVNYYTTLEGAMKKYKAQDSEFDMPEKLIKLYNDKNYGIYADINGTLPVNFLTNNDITGGNSGSPVLNAKGELIGLAFDGNSEALSGDIVFESQLQRTICVDIRYILFIIDKYAEAQNIIQELLIVK